MKNHIFTELRCRHAPSAHLGCRESQPASQLTSRARQGRRGGERGSVLAWRRLPQRWLPWPLPRLGASSEWTSRSTGALGLFRFPRKGTRCARKPTLGAHDRAITRTRLLKAVLAPFGLLLFKRASVARSQAREVRPRPRPGADTCLLFPAEGRPGGGGHRRGRSAERDPGARRPSPGRELGGRAGRHGGAGGGAGPSPLGGGTGGTGAPPAAAPCPPPPAGCPAGRPSDPVTGGRGGA